MRIRWFVCVGLAMSNVAQAQSWTFGGGGTVYPSDDAACEALANDVDPSYDMVDLEPTGTAGLQTCYYGPPGDESHATFGMVFETDETSSCEGLDGLAGAALGDELERRMTNAVDSANRTLAQHPKAIFRDVLPSHGELSQWASQPKLFPLAYGHVLEEMSAMAVSRDRCLSQYLAYIPNKDQKKPGGVPDFRGKGAAAGLQFDITTRGERERKRSTNPNKAKPEYRYVLYERLFQFGD